MCKQILTSGYSVKLSMGFLSVITKIHGFILRSAIAMAETERLSENKKISIIVMSLDAQLHHPLFL